MTVQTNTATEQRRTKKYQVVQHGLESKHKANKKAEPAKLQPVLTTMITMICVTMIMITIRIMTLIIIVNYSDSETENENVHNNDNDHENQNSNDNS